MRFSVVFALTFLAIARSTLSAPVFRGLGSSKAETEFIDDADEKSGLHKAAQKTTAIVLGTLGVGVGATVLVAAGYDLAHSQHRREESTTESVAGFLPNQARSFNQPSSSRNNGDDTIDDLD
ncbi:hypothetical protein BC835DRAFT_1415945 [Cytidiella melzeri]|nr:hypothetical protein BC835DRAFT_1415945 [Cytidiella melzeri]